MVHRKGQIPLSPFCVPLGSSPLRTSQKLRDALDPAEEPTHLPRDNPNNLSAISNGMRQSFQWLQELRASCFYVRQGTIAFASDKGITLKNSTVSIPCLGRESAICIKNSRWNEHRIAIEVSAPSWCESIFWLNPQVYSWLITPIFDVYASRNDRAMDQERDTE